MARMHPPDDEELRELLPRLRRFARSLTRARDEADDLVQAALERALRGWSGRRDETALQPWLFSILYRQFIDETRRARRRTHLLGLLAAQAPPVAPSAERIHEDHAVLANLAQLPDEQRALLLLVAVEGLSYRDVAVALDIPIGTVMSRLSRARDHLRALSEGNTKETVFLRRVK